MDREGRREYSAIPSRSFEGRICDISAFVDRDEFIPINDDFFCVPFLGIQLAG